MSFILSCISLREHFLSALVFIFIFLWVGWWGDELEVWGRIGAGVVLLFLKKKEIRLHLFSTVSESAVILHFVFPLKYLQRSFISV